MVRVLLAEQGARLQQCRPALTAAKAEDIASAATKQHKAAAAILLSGICAKSVCISVLREQRCKLVNKLVGVPSALLLVDEQHGSLCRAFALRCL